MDAESLLDQIKAFGARLGLPKADVDKLVDIRPKNIDALGRSAQAAGAGAKALADKRRVTIEAAFRETSVMVRYFHPTGERRKFSQSRRSTLEKPLSSPCRAHATSLS